MTGITGALGSAARAAQHRSPGPVPRRVAALLAPAPSVRPLLVAAAAAVVMVSAVAALDAASALHALVELAQAPARLPGPDRVGITRLAWPRAEPGQARPGRRTRQTQNPARAKEMASQMTVSRT